MRYSPRTAPWQVPHPFSARFRAGRNPVDQIYTLRQLVEKCTDFNKEMYICYIDFKKAFDSIWRDELWRVKRNMNYPEEIISILENMYEGTLSAVRVRGELTDWFETIVPRNYNAQGANNE